MEKLTERMEEDVTEVVHEVVQRVKEVVDTICKVLVDHPDDVKVKVYIRGQRLFVDLETNSNDVGQVIGKNGHLKSSMRSFLSAIGGKYNVKPDLDYITERENRKMRYDTVGNLKHRDDDYR